MHLPELKPPKQHLGHTTSRVAHTQSTFRHYYVHTERTHLHRGRRMTLCCWIHIHKQMLGMTGCASPLYASSHFQGLSFNTKCWSQVFPLWGCIGCGTGRKPLHYIYVIWWWHEGQRKGDQVSLREVCQYIKGLGKFIYRLVFPYVFMFDLR